MPELNVSASRLLVLLEQLDLTNTDLAAICGVDRSTVHRWLKDDVAIPHAVIRLLETRQKVRELSTWLGDLA